MGLIWEALLLSGVSTLYWERAKPALSDPQILYNLISVPQHEPLA